MHAYGNRLQLESSWHCDHSQKLRTVSRSLIQQNAVPKALINCNWRLNRTLRNCIQTEQPSEIRMRVFRGCVENLAAILPFGTDDGLP